MAEDTKVMSTVLSKGMESLGYSDICITFKKASQHLMQSIQCQKAGTEVIANRQGEGMTGFKVFSWLSGNNDIHVTYVNNMFRVEDDDYPRGKITSVPLQMDTRDTRPGYVKLKFANSLKQGMIGGPLLKNYPYFASSTFCQILEDAAAEQNVFSQYQNQHMQSKVVQLHDIDVQFQSNGILLTAKPAKGQDPSKLSVTKDFGHALNVKKWPKQATKWRDRKRVDWPTSKMQAAIVGAGCHLIPKGHHLSSKKDMEWRITFPDAEMTLLDSLNEIQRKCYALMKIILQDLLNPVAPECLSSYHMKTILFWIVESTEGSLWMDENLVLCFHLCVLKLKTWVTDSNIPHYFIQENNLIEGKLNEIKKKNLIAKLSEILKNIWESLSKCESFKYIRQPLFELKKGDILEKLARWFLLVEIAAVDKECTTSIGLMRWKMQSQSASEANPDKAIQNLQGIKADILRSARREGPTACILIDPLISLLEHHIGTLKYGLCMSKKRKKGKEHDAQFQEAAGLFKKTINMDLGCGPLTMATFHISNKDYKKATVLIQQVIEAKDIIIAFHRVVPKAYPAAEDMASVLYCKGINSFLQAAPTLGVELEKLYGRFLKGFHPGQRREGQEELGDMAIFPSWLCGCLVFDVQYMSIDYYWVPVAVQFEVVTRPRAKHGTTEELLLESNMTNLVTDKSAAESTALLIAIFHPLVYAYYLKFLCWLHSSQKEGYEKIIEEFESISMRVHSRYQRSTFNLLGWCFLQVENFHMAAGYFLKSLMILTTVNNAAFWHLGIMITSQKIYKVLASHCHK